MEQQKITQIVEILKAAGRQVVQLWPGLQPSRSLSIKRKQDGTVVSEADLISNIIIREQLESLFKRQKIISEEDCACATISAGESYWLLDPLDGSWAFVEGRRDFSIHLALIENGHVQVGFIYFPVDEELFFASRGGGAFGPKGAIKVSQSKVLKPQSILTRHFDAFPVQFSCNKKFDSGFAFRLVAAGEIDGFVGSFDNLHPWDIAAACLIVKEAGGKMTDEFNNEFAFHSLALTSHCFIASNGLVHSPILTLVRQTLKEMDANSVGSRPFADDKPCSVPLALIGEKTGSS